MRKYRIGRFLTKVGLLFYSIISIPLGLLFVASLYAIYLLAMPFYLLHERVNRLLTWRLIEVVDQSIHLKTTFKIRVIQLNDIDEIFFEWYKSDWKNPIFRITCNDEDIYTALPEQCLIAKINALSSQNDYKFTRDGDLSQEDGL